MTKEFKCHNFKAVGEPSVKTSEYKFFLANLTVRRIDLWVKAPNNHILITGNQNTRGRGGGPKCRPDTLLLKEYLTDTLL